MTKTRRRRMSPTRHLAFGCVTVALASALVLLVAEIYVRATQPYYTAQTLREQSLQFTPQALARYVLTPNQQLENPRIRINAQGTRGPDFSFEKTPGTTRIMFLGGSMVFTIDTPDGEDWPSLTGSELKARGIGGIEIINAGVPGNTSADSLGRFHGELWAYHPDFVVICMAWNDLKQLRFHESRQSLLRTTRSGDPNQDPRQNYRNGPDRWLSETSQVYVRLRSRYFDWRIPSGVEGAIPEGRLIERFDPESLAQFRLTLKLITDAVRHAGGTPVLVTQPTLVVDDSPPEDRSRIRYDYVLFSHEALVDALEGVRQATLEIAEQQGVPAIDAYPGMSGKSAYFHDHVHTTPAGSREIARIVAEGLIPLLEQGEEAP